MLARLISVHRRWLQWEPIINQSRKMDTVIDVTVTRSSLHKITHPSSLSALRCLYYPGHQLHPNRRTWTVGMRALELSLTVNTTGGGTTVTGDGLPARDFR